MEPLEQERRGLFDGLTVPHSLNAVVAASIGLLVYYGGLRFLEGALESAIPGTESLRLFWGMAGNVSSRLGAFGAFCAEHGGWENVRTAYDPFVWLLFALWTGGVWATFATAVCRIAAVDLARQELLGLRDAFAFAARKALPTLLSLVLVLVIVGVFWVVTNAGIAGGVMHWFPWGIGDVVVGVLFVFVLISSTLMVFAVVLGLFGFNLTAAAIATEASDTLDGVSRAWLYIISRPWQVVLTTTAILLYLTVIVFFGNRALQLSVRSLSVGWWGAGVAARTVELDRDERVALGLPDAIKQVHLPGKADFLYRRVILGQWAGEDHKVHYPQSLTYALEKYKEHTGRYPDDLQALLTRPRTARDWYGPYLEGESLPLDRWGRPLVYQADPSHPDGYVLSSLGFDGQPGTADDGGIEAVEAQVGPLGPALDVAPALERSLVFAGDFMAFWVWLGRLVLWGYVVAYFLSAQTTVYFLLRKDVEGDDYDELDSGADQDDAEEDPDAEASSAILGTTDSDAD